MSFKSISKWAVLSLGLVALLGARTEVFADYYYGVDMDLRVTAEPPSVRQGIDKSLSSVVTIQTTDTALVGGVYGVKIFKLMSNINPTAAELANLESCRKNALLAISNPTRYRLAIQTPVDAKFETGYSINGGAAGQQFTFYNSNFSCALVRK